MPAPIILPILSIFKSAGLNQARQALLSASKDFDGLASNIGKAAGAFSAFTALASARDFMIQSVDVTQRYERNLLALQQVFENITPEMRAFTKEVESYGLSQSQAAQASVFLGSVLKQYGFSVEESAGQTQRLVKLAQDLAVTYGYDVQEALLAITALFRGEYDPIEKFGVAMKQNEVNARVAADGLGDLEGEAANLAQAQARLTMLFERAGDSMGAFERASNTLYASQQLLAAGIENLQVAFGAPLQEPLAAIQAGFAGVVNDGDGIVQIAESIGGSLEALGPTFVLLADVLMEILQPLQQVIDLLNILLRVVAIPLNAALQLIVSAFEAINYVLDAFTILIGAASSAVDDFVTGSGADFINWLSDAADDSVIIGFFRELVDEINRGGQAFENFVDRQRNDRLTATSRDMAMLANATRLFGNTLGDVEPELTTFEQSVKEMGRGSEEAKDKLKGIEGVLYDIEVAAKKSQVTEAFKEMGFSASQIEYFLTKPDWATIFGTISYYAKLAALDISKASYAGAVGIMNARAELEKLLKSDFGKAPREAAKKQAVDYVDAFTDALRNSVQQRAARLQLEQLGATAGLIDKILGSDNWMKVWLAIKSGTLTVKELQSAFNQTADGVKEATEAANELAEKLKEIDEIASESGSILDRLIPREDLPQFQAEVRDVFDELTDQLNKLFEAGKISEGNRSALGTWANAMQKAAMEVAVQRDQVVKQIEETEKRIAEVQKFGLSDSEIDDLTQPISLIAEQVSEYEQQVNKSIDFMRDKIREGAALNIFDNKAVKQLEDLVNSTRTALLSIARDRQAIANEMQRLQDALTFRNATKEAILAYADVTTILQDATAKLQSSISKSAKSTYEIVAQTIKSARNARDYRVVLVKELKEAEEVSANATSITDGLRKVLEDTKLFASNLDKLRSLGLDAKVYEQIVAAGVEVGNKTAQAIIDGGPEVVKEINNLWAKIGEYSTSAAVIAADTVYGLGGDVIESTMAGLRSKDSQLAAEATVISQNMVKSFQAPITAYKVDLEKVLTDLKNKKTALEEAATFLGKAFADKISELVKAALSGIKVEISGVDSWIAGLKSKIDAILATPLPAPLQPGTGTGAGTSAGTGGGDAGGSGGGGYTPPAAVFQEGGTGTYLEGLNQGVDFLINSASDLTKITEYLNLRVLAANEFAADALRAGNRAASESAQATAQEFLQTLKDVRAMSYTGTPTVVNINVKTDTTQSAAMVGKTIGRTVTKYVTTGGGILVSPVG